MALEFDNLSRDLFEHGEGDSHEGFALWCGESLVRVCSRNVSLHVDVAVIGSDGSRAGSVCTQAFLRPVFSSPSIFCMVMVFSG